VTDKKLSGVQTPGQVRRTWEPMTVVRVGQVSDVLHAATGPMGDTMGGMQV